MSRTRWTLGAVLVGAVSVWGLTAAEASPFTTWLLSDDIGNRINGSAPEQSEWETDPGSGADENAGTDDGSSTDGAGNNGHGNNADGVDSSNPGKGKDNNGHGNNADGVDSSNPGQGKGGPNGAVDESCTDPTNCVDDEIKAGGSGTSSGSSTTTETATTTEETKTNNGKAKGKKK
ncbi:MAG: hypothetical protein WBM47_06970 [Polyangiales bacterium]